MSARYERLRARAPLGRQYDWLARFVRQLDVPSLELCIHVDDRAQRFVRPHAERVADEDGEGCWALREPLADEDLELFARYRFPLLALSKLEMREVASREGFGPLTDLTWFCHRPARDEPCGRCNPCRYTIEEGMAYRLPRAALLRYRLDPVIRLAERFGRGARRSVARAARRAGAAPRRDPPGGSGRQG